MKRFVRVAGLILLMVSLFASCKKKDEYLVTANGLKYRFIEQKNGRHPHSGELMRMHLKYRDTKDKVLYDSQVMGENFILQLTAPTFVGGIEEGFAMMGEGDSAIFLVPADSIFDKTFRQVLPPSVNKGDMLKFEVRMLTIMNADEYRKETKEDKKEVSELEDLNINVYLAENELNVTPAKPGIYFIVIKEGKGKKPAKGDSVEVRYTGSFLNGEVFDGSKKAGENLSYVLGDGLRLDAWEQAISSMKEGSICRLILSSENAFGKDGFGPVPPATPVVYDIELIRVKSAKATL
ncbi:MAG: FKBP-type peptidyl-prolyl cis-trans isomerase [Bacteroidia bacterium]|jgi:FKBP-type peptidyl-prolyl cis-trans isomerase FkpA|nr:FKBP-type peptidyl-prolyl cis-trans isomerase [Bacteroidia bacterium]